MHRALRHVWTAALVGSAGACSSPPEPTLDPLVYEVGGFRIEDGTRAASADLIDSIAAVLGAAVADVTTFLPEFPLPDDTITFQLLPGTGIPFVSPSTLVISQWQNGLVLEYLPHQVVHLATGYRQRPFLEEGIAVYASEVLDPSSTILYPHYGQLPHAWVSLFEQQGSTIPLATAFGAAALGYDYLGSTADASAWQVTVEGGSFTRWVFDAYGRDAWLRLYDLDDLTGALGADVADLEGLWLGTARLAYPNPLSCEEALNPEGVLTGREAFWCARARGE
ncbi:MAG: hypothetical protein OEW06_09855 [Gemmatimonadota bacterium]|nr:hypothetical protein [Gemmatimonadota bacterium]MDH4350085.1 hypothetical protein [Gemmatimonadota bacterium]